MVTSGSIRLRHLLILLTALGLLPLALVGAWGIDAAMAQQRHELERSMLDLSRALASAVDAELEGNIGALRTLSYTPALIKGDLALFHTIATGAVRSQPGWRSIVLADGDGRLLFTTALPYGAARPPLVDPESMARAAASGTPVVGRIARGPNGTAAFPVRVPVTMDGRHTYILSAAIRPDRILELLRRQKVPASWVVSVYDAAAVRVARSRDHERTVATGASATLGHLLAQGRREGIGVSRTLEGDEVVTAYTRIPRHGWSVAIGAPTAALRAALLRNFAVYAAAIAVSLALCIALAVLIARRIGGAIGAVQAQAVRLGRGEPVAPAASPIRELRDMGLALEAAARQRAGVEREREALMASLNAALARAEEAGRAKDDFLAVLGHELRNPLAPIVSALDLMDRRGDAGAAREREIMRRQVNHMKRLVDDLLDISRIARGMLELRRRPVDLRTIAAQAVEAAQPAAQARGCVLLLDAQGPAWVEGDESRLLQVLSNLLSNAIRFTAQGRVRVEVGVRGDQGRIAVADDGAGMTPETLAHVFDPFFQAPQSPARSAGGLGLGLAIVRSIAELHGGRVRADSLGLGQGSVLEVLLPAIAPPRPDAALPATPAAGVCRRVLVVDDNVDAALSLAALLATADHAVEVAHDGRAALASAARSLPDVAILDIGLPDMDGYALAAALRAAHPDWQGRLLALTGYGQDSDKARAAAAGFDRHLTKPVRWDELQAAVTA